MRVEKDHFRQCLHDLAWGPIRGSPARQHLIAGALKLPLTSSLYRSIDGNAVILGAVLLAGAPTRAIFWTIERNV